MPRSLKKGPFVDEHLLNKVDAQNEAGTNHALAEKAVELTKEQAGDAVLADAAHFHTEVDPNNRMVSMPDRA